jgi:DNA-binding PadR family transcriptional regulator
MKKRYIITKKQLQEYVEKKQAEKIFFNIIEDLYKNSKFLNENSFKQKANQTLINNYRRRGLLSSLVEDMLKKVKIIDEKSEII